MTSTNEPRTRKKLSASDVRRYSEMLKLSRDNFDCGDFWILHAGDSVTLCHQRKGNSPVAQITIPRQTFNAIVDWYMREQKPYQEREDDSQ